MLERQTGRVPTINQLAAELGCSADIIRSVIQQFLRTQTAESYSAFRASLLEILMNEQMLGHRVLVVDENGQQLGVLLTKDALSLARDKGLDLFLLQPDANPPVARIMDYGRYKFEQEKRLQDIKKRHHVSELKELKMRYEIDAHDYQVKVTCAQKFLSDGDKIKAQILLRGREVEHADLAVALLKRFADDLKDLAVIDRQPYREGKTVIMVLSPTIRVRHRR